MLAYYELYGEIPEAIAREKQINRVKYRTGSFYANYRQHSTFGFLFFGKECAVKVKLEKWTVEELVDARQKDDLRIPRYQRGEVWKEPQMRLLIDSMLRGYHIPLIYLEHVVRSTAKTRSEHYEIIDGQQRINAMRCFVKGAVITERKDGDIVEPGRFPKLYHPKDESRKFPPFTQRQDCPWGGKTFAGLSDQLRDDFLKIKVAVVVVESEDNDAITDMFIRLQGGSDLVAQQVRDAWPGKFCEMVIRLGGKRNRKDPAPGHDFFTKLMRAQTEVRVRETAAQILMLFLSWKEAGCTDDSFVDLNAPNLDDCYRRHIGLSFESPVVVRFMKILDELVDAFAGATSPKLLKPEAIDLVLLMDKLLDSGSSEWKESLSAAFEKFRGEVRDADPKIVKELSGDESEDFQRARRYWEIMKGQGQSVAAKLQERHAIFSSRMSALLGVDMSPTPYVMTSPGGGLPSGTEPLDKADSRLIWDDDAKVWDIGVLTETRNAQHLNINGDYQRGPEWKEKQQRMLIDSVMRGYPIPLIYLHKKESAKNLSFEIIDGQQRIDAFCAFQRDAFELFNPCKGDDKNMFPQFLHDVPCEWAGKRYGALLSAEKDKFKSMKVPVVEVVCKDNAAKDMFIRLQGGKPLESQEIRDAWPGQVCELVLRIGGKPRLGQDYRGHPFFDLAGGKDVQKRELVARLLMLFRSRKGENASRFLDVGGENIDKFYRESGDDLELNSPLLRRFQDILALLHQRFVRSGSGPKLATHEVIHLVLFTDMLIDDFSPSWKNGIFDAHRKFRESVARVRDYQESEVDENDRNFWEYSRRTGSNTVYARIIRPRHEIYVRQMLRFLGDNVKSKDPQRVFMPAQREAIYYRDNKRCHICGEEVEWDDAEIHHLEEHAKGGRTTLENGVLVHKQCHPRGRPKGS